MPGAHPHRGVSGITSTAPAATLRRDRAAVLARSFTPDSHLDVRTADGTTLHVFHALCSGTADGHCQALFAFVGDSSRPVWRQDYAGVLSLRATRDGFSVQAISYAAQDPLCCPSRPPVTDTYRWTGRSLEEHGPLPGIPH